MTGHLYIYQYFWPFIFSSLTDLIVQFDRLQTPGNFLKVFVLYYVTGSSTGAAFTKLSSNLHSEQLVWPYG